VDPGDSLVCRRKSSSMRWIRSPRTTPKLSRGTHGSTAVS